MEEHAKGFSEFQELCTKLSTFRENTAECAEKLLSELKGDKWIEKSLLNSLSDAAKEMEGLQDSLLNSLAVHNIQAGATLEEARGSILEWDKKELAKSIAADIGNVLKKVCALTYVGEEEAVKEDLAAIQKEASSLLADLKHYEAHQDRIDAMKKLVSWVESGNPLTLAEGALCNKLFGFNLYFAINAKQLAFGKEPVVMTEEKVAPKAEPKPTVDVKQKATAEPISTKWDIPESEFYDGSLTYEYNPVKAKMTKSATKFKNELENATIGMTNNVLRVLELLQLNMVFDPQNYKKVICKTKKEEELYTQAFQRVYDLGLSKKIRFWNSESYTLNRSLLLLYNTDTLKKMIRAKDPIMLQWGDIPDVWLARCFVKSTLIAHMQENYPNFLIQDNTPASVGSPASMFTVPREKEKSMHMGIMVPIFTKEHLDEELKVIEDFLTEAEKVETNLFVICKIKADRIYWEDKLKNRKIFRLLIASLDETDNDVTELDWAHTLAYSKEEEPVKAEEPIKPIKVEEAAQEEPVKEEVVAPEAKPAPVKEPVKVIETKKEEKPKKGKPIEEKQEETTSVEAVIQAEEEKEPITDVISAISSEIHKHHMAEGMLMLHGLDMQEQSDWARRLLLEISYVMGDPLYPQITPKEDAYNYWNYTMDVPGMEAEKARDYLNAAAMIRYFFKPSYNEGNWHWQSNQAWKQISDDSSNSALLEIPEIKKVISFFNAFLTRNEKGLGWCMGGDSKIQEQHEQTLTYCTNEVHNMSKRLEQKRLKRYNHTRVIQTYEKVCRDSTLALFLNSPADFSTKELLDFCNSYAEAPVTTDDILADEELTFTPSGAKLDQYMDEIWYSIEVAKKQNDHFLGTDRSSLKSLLVSAFEVLGNYVFARIRVESKSEVAVETSVVRKALEDAGKLCTDLIGRLQDKTSKNPLEELAYCALRYLVKSLLKSFNTNYQPMEFYEPFLLTNYVELSDRFLPIMDFSYRLPELSLYQRVKKHVEMIEKNHLTPEEECYETVRDSAYEAMNMGAYKLLSEKLSIDGQDEKEEDIETRGDEYLKKCLEDFRSELELAYNYGRLTQKDEIASYENLADSLIKHLKETGNYGLFELFAETCKERIDENSKPRQKELEEQFASLEEKLKKAQDNPNATLKDYPILNDIRKCLSVKNFSVAEDYMRQCQDGNLREIKNLLGSESNEFKTFMDSYQEYYAICSGNKRVNLEKTLDQWFPTKGKTKSSVMKSSVGKGQVLFVQQWDRLLSSTGRGTPETFLEMLGYPKILKTDVETYKQTNNRTAYDVSYKKEQIHQSAHPFKQFGSGIYDEGLRVITFTGAHTPETIISELKDAGVERNKGTICLLDACMPWADRCQLAKLMKCDESMYNVIVIDRVMALYLSQFPKLAREDKMMRLCMPFANATPFQAKGFIPPEMFIGRTKELADIRNMDGPNLVYGGRQLGKSILLRQVSFLDNHPENGKYAFYFDMKGKDEKLVLQDISKKLQKFKLISRPFSDWDDFASSIDGVMEKANQLILLIDEADAFILASNKINDKPIEVLRMTQNNFQGHFKFVLAGLHNVIRYDKSSLSSNTVYGQLGHINIKPFEYTEACDLLLRPLSYMGFTIENPDIVSTILAKTNYFPGLIQYYGLKLLESVKTAYQKYNFMPRNNPPYVLDEAYLKHLMEDDSFLKEIEEKFMITLRVDKDDDNYYYLLTLGIAYLYASDEKPVTLEKIKDILSGTRIAELSDDKLSALLEELQELNVLRKVDDSEYIFNRYSFYSMLGGSDKIEKALSEYEDK